MDLLPKRQTRSCQRGPEHGLMMPNKAKHHSAHPSLLFKPTPWATGVGNLHEDPGLFLLPLLPAASTGTRGEEQPP